MDSMCEHGPGHSEVLYDGPSNRVVSVGADSAMVLRDAATGEEVNLCVDEHDYTPIRALALSPAAADYTPQLITGCESGTIRVFSFPGLQFKSNLARFDAPVRQLAYSADGKLVAAVAEDSSVVQLFDAATEQPKCKLHKHAHHVRSVSFDPSGRYLASTGGDGAVAVWCVPLPPRRCHPDIANGNP
jgi:chromosome transmission fidelity protein 4